MNRPQETKRHINLKRICDMLKDGDKKVVELIREIEVSGFTMSSYLSDLMSQEFISRVREKNTLYTIYIYKFIKDYDLEPIHTLAYRNKNKESFSMRDGKMKITKTKTGYIVRGANHAPRRIYKAGGAKWTGDTSLGSF